MIVRELCQLPSNWRSEGTLDAYLRENQIPGISGIDTRALTRHIRTSGDIRGVLVRIAQGVSDDELIERANTARLPGDWDVVGLVGHDGLQRFGRRWTAYRHRRLRRQAQHRPVTHRPRRGRFGRSLRHAVRRHPGAETGRYRRLSRTWRSQESRQRTRCRARRLSTPMCPISASVSGHQLLARAIGADTGKLKFGHRGGNHPVKDLRTGQVSHYRPESRFLRRWRDVAGHEGLGGCARQSQ